jgi:uncharacterized protein (TIGR03083 family)
MPGSLNAMEFAGKDAVMQALRTNRATFDQLTGRSDAEWVKQTPCDKWQIRDLVGHMVDNTESYLERFDGARAGKVFPDAVGLLVMAELEDKGARKFRDQPRDAMLSRLKTSADRMFGMFDRLTETQWTTELVHHGYMGPLPAFFYPVFQLMDYSVHSWDAQQTLGINQPLTELSADLLAPFMFILLQYTVDASKAANRTIKCALEVSGPNGGKWTVTVNDGTFSFEPGGSAPATLSFNPSDYVLSCFQRMRGGQASGDKAAAETFRDLFFKI